MARLKTRVPILAVQKGLVALLTQGQSTKIYDDVVPKAKLPYISIGAINVKPNGSKDSAIYDVSVQIHLWSDYQGKFEINSMMNDVATVLSYAPIDTSADGFSIISQETDFINLPSNPDLGAAEVGKDFLLFVNTGTVSTPEWQMIGGQRNSGLTRQAETIDVSHKTSGGWSATKAGLRSWSIDLSGLVLLQDIGVHALAKAFEEGKDVFLKLKYPDDSYRTGWASVTEFSLDIPHDGAATISGSLSGLTKDSAPSTTSAGGTKA